MIARLVFVFGLLSYVTGFPTSTTLTTCSALQAAVPSGHQCSVVRRCTRLECSTTVLNVYPVKYNVTIHKCHDPVQVVFEVVSTGFHWSRTFEGNQTVQITSLSPGLELLVGHPSAHVEVNKVTGGIVMSATVWFDKNGHRTTMPIVDRHKIPLDTSDCQSIGSTGHDSLPSVISNPTDTFFFNDGSGSTQTGDGKLFSLPGELPTVQFDDYSPSDMSLVSQDMMSDPVFRKCVQQLLQQGNSDYWKSHSSDFDSEVLKCYCQKLKGGFTSFATAKCHSDLLSSNGKNKSTDTKWYVIGGCVGGAIMVAVVVAIVLFTIRLNKRSVPTVGVHYKELDEEEMEEE